MVNGIALGVVVVGESLAVEEYIEPLADQVNWLPDPRRPLGRRDTLWASELPEVVNEPVEAWAVHRGRDAKEEPFHLLHVRERGSFSGSGTSWLRVRIHLPPRFSSWSRS